MKRLDERSQQAVQGSFIRALILSSYMTVAWVLWLISLERVCKNLSLAFTIAASLNVLTAMLRHDEAGRGSFNKWDEALTFNGVALFTHMLPRLLS